MIRLWPLLVVLAACQEKPRVVPLRIAAAADVAAIVDAQVKPLWTEGPLEVISGASGLLSKQLQEGAPYDVFLAADEATVARVLAAQVCLPSSKRAYARGALALITASGISPAKALVDLTDARFKRIAIANPAHAPYGKAALQALQRSNLEETLKAKLVYGENVAQTLQLVRTGNADAALISRTLAGPEGVAIAGALHDPLVQTAVSCAAENARERAERFLTLITSAPVQKIFQDHGLLSIAGAPEP